MDTDEESTVSEDNNCSSTSEEHVAEKKKYMKLLQRIEEIRESDDTGPNVIQDIREILQELKATETDLRNSNIGKKLDESILDANILNAASDMIQKCLNSLQASSSNYDPTVFADKLIQFMMDPNEDEWQPKNFLKLVKDARRIVKKPPNYGSLYGAFDPATLPEPKQRKERQTRTQEVKEKLQKKTPENLVNARKEEQSVDEIVTHQRSVLEEEYKNNNHQPINYYKFVIDTQSFSATIENMFYFSFLIANGVAALYIDENNQPVIEPVSKKRREEFQKQGRANVQMIASMTEAEWKTFEIGVGFLQQRRLQQNSL